MSRQKKKYQIQSVGVKGIWWASLFCRICKYITEGNDAFIWREPPTRPQRLNDFHLAFAAHSFDRRQASIKTKEKYSLLIKIHKLPELNTLQKRCGSKTKI